MAKKERNKTPTKEHSGIELARLCMDQEPYQDLLKQLHILAVKIEQVGLMPFGDEDDYATEEKDRKETIEYVYNTIAALGTLIDCRLQNAAEYIVEASKPLPKPPA